MNKSGETVSGSGMLPFGEGEGIGVDHDPSIGRYGPVLPAPGNIPVIEIGLGKTDSLSENTRVQTYPFSPLDLFRRIAAFRRRVVKYWDDSMDSIVQE